MHAMDVTCNVVFSVSYTDVWRIRSRIRSFNHWYSMHVFRLITQPRLLVDVYKSSPTDFQEISGNILHKKSRTVFHDKPYDIKMQEKFVMSDDLLLWVFADLYQARMLTLIEIPHGFLVGKSCKSMEIPWNPYETHSHERPRFVSSFSVSIFKMFSVFMDFHKFFVVIPW